jgi:hypothetical protein
LGAGPILASGDESFADSASAYLFENKELRDERELTLVASHINVIFVTMGRSPSDGRTLLFPYERDATAGLKARKYFGEELLGNRRIDAPVRFERVFELLHAIDE